MQQNLRFQGQYLDRETGLHYNLFRYYDPVGGRFTQVDPIGLAGGLNTYAYVGDPLVWVDPLGWKGCKVREGEGTTHDIVLVLTHKEYKQTFGHIKDVIFSENRDIFTIDRTSASLNRAASLKGIPTLKGYDRDEFPMAMFKEGGKGASIRYIDPGDNRGAGSSIANALKPFPNGTKVKIIVE